MKSSIKCLYLFFIICFFFCQETEGQAVFLSEHYGSRMVGTGGIMIGVYHNNIHVYAEMTQRKRGLKGHHILVYNGTNGKIVKRIFLNEVLNFTQAPISHILYFKECYYIYHTNRSYESQRTIVDKNGQMVSKTGGKESRFEVYHSPGGDYSCEVWYEFDRLVRITYFNYEKQVTKEIYADKTKPAEFITQKLSADFTKTGNLTLLGRRKDESLVLMTCSVNDENLLFTGLKLKGGPGYTLRAIRDNLLGMAHIKSEKKLHLNIFKSASPDILDSVELDIDKLISEYGSHLNVPLEMKGLIYIGGVGITADSAGNAVIQVVVGNLRTHLNEYLFISLDQALKVRWIQNIKNMHWQGQIYSNKKSYFSMRVRTEEFLFPFPDKQNNWLVLYNENNDSIKTPELVKGYYSFRVANINEKGLTKETILNSTNSYMCSMKQVGNVYYFLMFDAEKNGFYYGTYQAE